MPTGRILFRRRDGWTVIITAGPAPIACMDLLVDRRKLHFMEHVPSVESIERAIFIIRGQRVMLDADLARLYAVQTERLNQQVRRNARRFPPDFAFRSRPVVWNDMYRQFAGTWQRRRRADRLPVAFAEHGCLMASNVLHSDRAMDVSVLVVRAFARMRTALAASAAQRGAAAETPSATNDAPLAALV